MAEGRSAVHLVEDQSAVAALLADPATHGGRSVARIDTHGAMVFIAGERVYKVKRAVRYRYMDFSTLALRQLACAREVVLKLEIDSRQVANRVGVLGAGQPSHSDAAGVALVPRSVVGERCANPTSCLAANLLARSRRSRRRHLALLQRRSDPLPMLKAVGYRGFSDEALKVDASVRCGIAVAPEAVLVKRRRRFSAYRDEDYKYQNGRGADHQFTPASIVVRPRQPPAWS